MRIVALIVAVMFTFGVASGQRVTISPFDIAPPTIYDKLKAVATADPKKNAVDLVEEANKILQTDGIAFIFSLDEASCTAIAKSIKELKEKSRPLNLSTKLRSVGADAATLRLPPANFSNGQCSKCSVTLPIFEVTDHDFIALMLGNNIKFHRPTNFITAEAFLLDSKDPKVVKVRWRLPYKAEPLGVSYYENVIYLPLPDPELKHLALAVFAEGGYQFATREEAESNGKAVAANDLSTDPMDAGKQFVRFDNRGISQTVKFELPCN